MTKPFSITENIHRIGQTQNTQKKNKFNGKTKAILYIIKYAMRNLWRWIDNPLYMYIRLINFIIINILNHIDFSYSVWHVSFVHLLVSSMKYIIEYYVTWLWRAFFISQINEIWIRVTSESKETKAYNLKIIFVTIFFPSFSHTVIFCETNNDFQ